MIRNATVFDLDGIVAVTRRAIKNAPAKFHASRLTELVGGLIRTETGGAVVYIDDAERVAGVLAYAVAPWNHSHELFAQEALFCVDPEYTGKGAASALLNAATAESKAKGARYFLMHAPEYHKPESVAGFYRKLGFKKTETSYLREI